MTKIERIDRTLAGQEVDRPPVSFWYHFGVQHAGGERIAELSLEFFRYYDLDWLKLMNDYYYPMPEGSSELRSAEDLKRLRSFDVLESDWKEQLKAIDIIAQELDGTAYFIDTIFEPWQVLQRNLVGEHLPRLVQEAPEAVLEALEVVTDNVIAYCKESLKRGAAGIFVSTFASEAQMSREQYRKFAGPFVSRIFHAVEGQGRMNTAHIHNHGIYLDDVVDFPCEILSFEDRHPSNPSIADAKERFAGSIMGGLDKDNVTRVTPAGARRNAETGIREGGKTRFLLAPGCSVPGELYPGAALAVVQAAKTAGE
jgi:uroporphyrinogen decarboxylase